MRLISLDEFFRQGQISINWKYQFSRYLSLRRSSMLKSFDDWENLYNKFQKSMSSGLHFQNSKPENRR